MSGASLPPGQEPAAGAGFGAGSTFRVFLTTGEALPAHGEPAFLHDRIVFTLIVGADPAKPEVQVTSLPLDRIDEARTRRYVTSVRAAYYAATRGEADFEAMTAEVRRAIDRLAAIEDPRRRLALAEEAKQRLLDWSRDNYSYRADDIAELAELFDEVIAELRVAAGESRFAIDLRAQSDDPVHEPLLPEPTPRESLALAFAAARAAGPGDERLAILRAAGRAAESEGDEETRAEAARALARESEAERAYDEFFAGVRARAAEARRQGNVEALERLESTVRTRDAELGARRPEAVRGLLGELEDALEDVRVHRLALERYRLMRPTLLAYERRIRRVSSGMDGLHSLLEAVAGMRTTPYERLESASRRLAVLMRDAARVTPPDDLSDVHATLQSALRLAEEACARLRLAVTTLSTDREREASTAAAGAMLLAAQARQELVRRLYPPKLQ